MHIPDTELNWLKLRYRKTRTIGISIGSALMIVWAVLIIQRSPIYPMLTFLVLGALVWGGYYWVKYKGRGDAWAFVMLFGPLGFIVLWRLADKWPWEKIRPQRRKKFTRE